MTDLKQDAVDVFLYGYPLMMTEAIHWGSDDKQFEHCREFPTDAYKRITKLNMDTLYSYAWTQLAHTPYLIHIPKITERYVLFPIMNAYGDVIYSIGTRTPEQYEGDYILLYKDEPVPKGYEQYKVLRSEDSLNSVLLRIETRGKKDYAFVRKLQDSITIKPLYEEKVEKVPDGEGIIPAMYLEELSAIEYFTQFAKLEKYNAIKDEKILASFERLGYQKENSTLDERTLSEEQWEALCYGKKQGLLVMKRSHRSSEAIVEKNQWSTLLGEVGVFGTKYLQRAACAYEGWGGNIVQDTLYSVTNKDIDGDVLDSAYVYKLHINADEYPHAAIFWSITLYGAISRFPVKNPIDRFSVNNYDLDEGLIEKNQDGSLDLYLSKEEPKDPHQRKNWLPTPWDETHFNLAIRNYWPDEMSLRGEWNPPTITKIG